MMIQNTVEQMENVKNTEDVPVVKGSQVINVKYKKNIGVIT